MVDITTNEYEKKWITEHIVLDNADIWPNLLAETRVYEAQRFIRKQGYHLRTYPGYAGIRLEVNRYTIIEVETSELDIFHKEVCTADCICYAAMLLYRRLKRDGVIA